MKLDTVSEAGGAVRCRLASVMIPAGHFLVLLPGRGIVPSAIAPRPDGKAWLAYRQRDLHLDLMDVNGEILQSTESEQLPAHLAVYDREDLLVAYSSPPRLFYTSGSTQHALFSCNFKYSAIAASSSGLAFSSCSRIYWVSLDDETLEWVLVDSSPQNLGCVCSLALLTHRGKTLIFAADRGKRVVHTYEMKPGGTAVFVPRPPFYFWNFTKRGSVEKPSFEFLPISISAHPSGFLAVLDAASVSVIILDVEKAGLASVTAVIPGGLLCFGVPAVIAFATKDPERDPRLWVGSACGHICITPLRFSYQ